MLMSGRANVTASEKEAFALLRRTRKALIAAGREIAIRQCLANGTTDTGQVFAEMERLEVPGLQSVKAYWLPAVFRDARFAPVDVELKTGLGHDKLAHTWGLAWEMYG